MVCGGVQEDMFLAFWPSNFCPMLRNCVAVTFLVIFMIKVYKLFYFPCVLFIDFFNCVFFFKKLHGFYRLPMFLSLLELLKCCIELMFFSFSFPYRKEKFIVYVFTLTNLKQTFCLRIHCFPVCQIPT